MISGKAIQLSHIHWASLIIIVQKKNESTQFWVDYVTS